MPAISLNPLDWNTGVYAVLMVACLVVRWMIPASHQRSVRLVREVLMIAPAALFYFLVRGLVHARGDVAIEHAHQLIDFEKALGIFHEPQLQSYIIGHEWLVDFVNWIYIWGHWPFLAAVFAWIVIAHPRAYPKYRNTMFLSGLIGMAEGRLDGDALFFSRTLSIEGDMEATLALRNALDDARLDFGVILLGCLGPLGTRVAEMLRRQSGQSRPASAISGGSSWN